MSYVNELSRSQRYKLRQQADDLASVLASDSGRRFVRRLLDQTGLFAPVTTMEQAAVRQVGLGLVDDMNAISPTVFPKLMLEAANERLVAQVAEEKAEQVRQNDNGEDDVYS